METQEKVDSHTTEEVKNGTAMAAVLGAAIGSFALGLIVLLNAMDLISIPAIYEPAGGVSGRTTLAVILWLISWGVLHVRWKDQQISYRKTLLLSLALIAGSLIFTFPPFWRLF